MRTNYYFIMAIINLIASSLYVNQKKFGWATFAFGMFIWLILESLSKELWLLFALFVVLFYLGIVIWCLIPKKNIDIKININEALDNLKIHKIYYIHYNFRLGIFRFAFYKLENKFTFRFECSKGWED